MTSIKIDLFKGEVFCLPSSLFYFLDAPSIGSYQGPVVLHQKFCKRKVKEKKELTVQQAP